MPPRSSSRKKSNRHLRKPNNTNNNNNNKHFTSQPNRHSSPARQSQGEVDSYILREQNGRNGNCPVKPCSSEKCQLLVVEEEGEKKKGVSDNTGHNEMEGSVEETRRVLEESEGEDKQVVGLDEEKVKTIVESDAALVEAEEQGSFTVEQKEEEKEEERSSLFESEKGRDASEFIVDDVKELEAELKQKENQEGDSQETTEPPSEQINEPSLALETETSREEAEAEAAADKLESSEEKQEESSIIETNEALVIGESSVPETDVASRAIDEETTPIVEPEESGETKLAAEEQKVEESTVVRESSKEEEEAAKESLPPSDVATAETTSTTLQEKTEIPTSAESQQTTDPPLREYSSWSSCCGFFDFLCR